MCTHWNFPHCLLSQLAGPIGRERLRNLQGIPKLLRCLSSNIDGREQNTAHIDERMLVQEVALGSPDRPFDLLKSVRSRTRDVILFGAFAYVRDARKAYQSKVYTIELFALYFISYYLFHLWARTLLAIRSVSSDGSIARLFFGVVVCRGLPLLYPRFIADGETFLVASFEEHGCQQAAI